jgi:hypothetical protein
MATIEDLISAERSSDLWRQRLTALADRNDYTYEEVSNIWNLGVQSVRIKIQGWQDEWPKLVQVLTTTKPHTVHFNFAGPPKEAVPPINPDRYGERLLQEIRTKLFWLAPDAPLNLVPQGRWDVRNQRGALKVITPSGDSYLGRFDNGWLVTEMVSA